MILKKQPWIVRTIFGLLFLSLFSGYFINNEKTEKHACLTDFDCKDTKIGGCEREQGLMAG